MEASRFKRRALTNKQRANTNKNTFGNSVVVSKAVSVYPQTAPLKKRTLSQFAVESAFASQAPSSHMRQTAPITRQRMHAPIAPQPLRQPTAQAVIPQPSMPAPIYTAPVQPLQASPPTAVAPSAPQPIAPRRSLLDMSLPGEESPVRFSGMFSPKWHRARTWAFRGAALSLVMIITLGGLFLSQSYLNANKVFKGTTGTATALNEDVAPELLKGEGDGRVNILLMGRGGGGHTAPDLTDTLMVASIDPVNKTATLLSIPRDLWVDVPGGGPMKINAAWATGQFKYLGKVKPGSTDPKAIEAGFKNVDTVIEKTLGINIHYNMIADFKAFKQAIDTVGGVAVNVPADLVDPAMAWENNNNPVLAKAGLQSFDGTGALMYVRSRQSTSDFDRANRQRSVMMALKGKMQELGTLSNPVKISGLISAFGNNVSTDLSMNNASRLYTIMKSIKDTNTVSASLVDTNNTYVTTSNIKGQSVVIPKAGAFNYNDIQNFVRTQLKDPYIMKEKAKVLVLNGTPQAGIATKRADELKAYGYNVIGIGNTPNTGWTTTTLVDLTHKNKYTKNYLERRLGMSASNTLNDQTVATNGADFVIIIGSDTAQP